MDIRLPFPPSVNGYWRAFKRGNICTQIISKKGREYRAAVEDKMFVEWLMMYPPMWTG